MNRLTAIGLASLVAYGVLLFAKWDGAPASAATGSSEVLAAEPAANQHASADVLVQARPAPRPRLVSPASYSHSAALNPSSVESQFRSSRDLKSFADALLARKESLNREERYYLAKALETCGFATSINDDLATASDKRRRQFLATIPAADPEAARRIAAYDAADDTQRCLRFQGVRITQKQIEDLYRQASEGGDPRAQARLLVAELNRNLTTPKTSPESSRTVGNEDFQRIIGLLETRDAEAMVMVAQFLAQHRLIGELRIGTTGEVPEPASLVGAFSLVACDFQPTCPAFDREVLQACAYAGYCSAGSYEELYANFLASPWSYSQAMRYRGVIHTAIETRNWSLLGLQKLIGAKSNAGS
ncbi:MAG TPA: hypothetical protein PK042_00425 [Usitatibacteraceae bacterium]|nr:hypothetical protein [Usitatibacteraceae bacterium]